MCLNNLFKIIYPYLSDHQLCPSFRHSNTHHDYSEYAGSSRGGGGLAQNAHYDYGQQQQQRQQVPHMSTFFT